MTPEKELKIIRQAMLELATRIVADSPSTDSTGFSVRKSSQELVIGKTLITMEVTFKHREIEVLKDDEV